MSLSTRCTICNIRPAAAPSERMSVDQVYCTPCSTLADHENTHSDQAHDEIARADAAGEKLTRKGWNFKTQKAMDEWLASEREIMAECWVCKPELDETQKPYVQRKGVSRVGQTQIVPGRAAGEIKAEAVRVALAEIGWTATVSFRKGVTTLAIPSASFRLQWDIRGCYLYGPSVFGDRKIRNAKEAVRLLDGARETVAA
jgi:hypothetical protein